MLLKSCNRCGMLVPYGQVYCNKCAPIIQGEREARAAKARQQANRAYNSRRDPKYGGFYRGREWRMLARKRLQTDGYKCVKCGAFATEVDHIVPIQTPEGWERRLDFENTQALCTKCHNEKHKRFQRKKKRKTI